MASGGARHGAGRKPSAITVKTRAAAERLRGADGETPLDVMAGTMRELWRLATTEDGKPRETLHLDTAERACAIAKDLAPYLHPKLQSIEVDSGPPPEINVKVDLLALARQVAYALRRADQRLLGAVMEGG